jgi:hypothetical protein
MGFLAEEAFDAAYGTLLNYPDARMLMRGMPK